MLEGWNTCRRDRAEIMTRLSPIPTSRQDGRCVSFGQGAAREEGLLLSRAPPPLSTAVSRLPHRSTRGTRRIRDDLPDSGTKYLSERFGTNCNLIRERIA